MEGGKDGARREGLVLRGSLHPDLSGILAM